MARALPLPLAEEDVVQRLLDSSRADDCIGDLIAFGCTGLEIPPEELRAFLRARNIDEWAPVDIQPRVAARKAIALFRPALETGELKVMVRKAHEDESQVRYAFVAEGQDRKTKDLEYGTVNQVIFDKRSGELSFTHRRVPEIVTLYEHLCSVYTQRELLTITKNILKSFGGYPFKIAGGLWFMPARARPIVDALRALYNEDIQGYHSARAYFRPLGIQSDADAKFVVAATLQQQFNDEIGETAHLLETALKSSNPKARTVEAAVRRIKELKGKSDLYEGLLEIDLTWIEQSLKKAAERVTVSLVKQQRAAVSGAATYSSALDTEYVLE